MNRWLRLASTPSSRLPQEFEGDDVRFSEELVEFFIGKYTRPGDLVLDPFAGFGTALAAASAMERRSVGIELLEDRVAFIRSRVPSTAVVHCGDALQLSLLALTDVQLVITSPPYMTRNGHPENPLTGYRQTGSDYLAYLQDLTEVFRQARSTLAPGGRVIINVANLRHDGLTTPLAWDLTTAVSEVLTFERELVIVNDDIPEWITQEYCLVFHSE